MNFTKKLYLAILLIAALIGGLVAGQQIREYVFPSGGEISTIGVSLTWLDKSPVITLDWGVTDNATEYTMEPINITNTENTPVTLALITQNLSPSIISLTLTWNYTGAILNPGEWQVVGITQDVTATGPYSYETVVRAIEA